MSETTHQAYIRPMGVRIDLADGISAKNGWTLMYASFATIGFLTFINTGQAFVLNANLNLPGDEQGRLTGALAFWNEIITIALAAPFGVMADRIGRRPVFVFGMVSMAFGYALYPYADSVTDLFVARTLYGLGTAAAAGMIGIVGQDYPREYSRGKLIAWSGVMNSLGVIFTALVFGRMFIVLENAGMTAKQQGLYTFWAVAFVLVISAWVLKWGLKGGVPPEAKIPQPIKDLFKAGLTNAKNPRIALSYASAFVARSDLVVIGAFTNLWGSVWGIQQGMSPAEAALTGLTIFAIAQLFGLAWSPIMGMIIDRVNRVSAVVFGMGFAAIGYSSMYFVDDPTNPIYYPLFGLLGIGQISAFFASQALMGQEAPAKERGAVIGFFSGAGAIGILVATSVGGILFDTWMLTGPFVFVGALNFCIFVFAFFVWKKSPGMGPEEIKALRAARMAELAAAKQD
ncbi:MAG: MFS transporter [Rhodospirillaceae bacterium]|nr:MFS transporter [Rhodospirillaceae bacterium]MBT6088101.1 MFS transporter [Rhodospirillaceae bacterium]